MDLNDKKKNNYKYIIKAITLLLTSVLIILSCSDGKEFTIDCTLESENYNNKRVYMFRLSDDLTNLILIDSALIKSQKFTFRNRVPKCPEGRYLFIGKEGIDRINHAPVFFIPEKGSIKIVLDKNLYSFVSGTPGNDKLQQLQILEKNLLDKKREYQNETLKNDTLRSDNISFIVIEQIKDQLGNAVYDYLQNIRGTCLYDELFMQYVPYLNREQSIKSRVQAGFRFFEKELADSLFSKIGNKAAVGEPFIDAICITLAGEKIALSEYLGKGKIVLLDFWSSWCKPCIAEIPFLREAYKQYKDKDFEIIGISIDTNRTLWLNAIESHRMDWLQLQAGTGFQSAIPTYGIDAIPQLILIDKDGIVVVKNMRGKDIKTELEKLLKES